MSDLVIDIKPVEPWQYVFSYISKNRHGGKRVIVKVLGFDIREAIKGAPKEILVGRKKYLRRALLWVL